MSCVTVIVRHFRIANKFLNKQYKLIKLQPSFIDHYDQFVDVSATTNSNEQTNKPFFLFQRLSVAVQRFDAVSLADNPSPYCCHSRHGFYARKQLLLSARLSHRNSVCPSVCPTHGWISQKLCKIGSPNLHRRLLERL